VAVGLYGEGRRAAADIRCRVLGAGSVMGMLRRWTLMVVAEASGSINIPRL